MKIYMACSITQSSHKQVQCGALSA